MSRARRCPACGVVNRPTATQCQCGQGFDEDEAPEDLRHLYTHKLTIGWMMVIGGVLLLAFSLALVFVISLFAVVPAAASAALILKGALMVGHAREGLRGVRRREAELPKAKVV